MGFFFPATMIAIAVTVVLTIVSQNGVIQGFAQLTTVLGG